MHVEVKIQDPMVDGFSTPREGKSRQWIQIKYEKLFDLIFASHVAN